MFTCEVLICRPLANNNASVLKRNTSSEQCLLLVQVPYSQAAHIPSAPSLHDIGSSGPCISQDQQQMLILQQQEQHQLRVLSQDTQNAHATLNQPSCVPVVEATVPWTHPSMSQPGIMWQTRTAQQLPACQRAGDLWECADAAAGATAEHSTRAGVQGGVRLIFYADCNLF